MMEMYLFFRGLDEPAADKPSDEPSDESSDELSDELSDEPSRKNRNPSRRTVPTNRGAKAFDEPSDEPSNELSNKKIYWENITKSEFVFSRSYAFVAVLLKGGWESKRSDMVGEGEEEGGREREGVSDSKVNE